MRLFLAILLCKLARFALRLTGRGGTALPGKLALAVCPDMLARLAKGMDIVMVTGTNGKTTTSRMVEQMLTDANRAVLANRSGSNLEQGIAAELAANASLTGKPRLLTAVIECDEAAFRTVAKKLQPQVIVVTNLFRDQLDRYGEVTHTLELIREGVQGVPNAVLCLNADCSLTASLADGVPNRIRAFGMDVPQAGASEGSDAPRCIHCGTAYAYTYRTFAHLGGFSCPKCGYARQEPAVAVSAVRSLAENESEAAFTVDGTGWEATVALPAVYNLYNAAAAVAAASAMGVEAKRALLSLADIQSGFGRMERFQLGDVPVMLILVKNPAGCDRALEYLETLSGSFTAVLCLNDNFADGTDVSWIWDASFERLLACARPPRLIVSGTRAEDMRLRLKYAGAAEDAVTLLRSTEEVLRAVEQSGEPVYILPTYTAMLPLRAELSRRCGKSDFWE